MIQKIVMNVIKKKVSAAVKNQSPNLAISADEKDIIQLIVMRQDM